MSTKFCPSDGLKAEPDLLSLSGQTISRKLKSPRTWTEGGFPTTEEIVFNCQVKDHPLPVDQTYFRLSSKKMPEKSKKSHFGQIQVQLEFCIISYCDSVMKEQSLLIHMSH